MLHLLAASMAQTGSRLGFQQKTAGNNVSQRVAKVFFPCSISEERPFWRVKDIIELHWGRFLRQRRLRDQN